MEIQISNEQAKKQVKASHTEFDDKFSFEELELAFSDDGDTIAEQMVERVKWLKDALNGALWHKFKVLRNDYDVYVYWDTKFKNTLHNGILPGYKTSEGKPMYAWKSNKEQLEKLNEAMVALKMAHYPMQEVMIECFHENGNPVLNENGQQIYEMLMDEDGNPVMEYIMDEKGNKTIEFKEELIRKFALQTRDRIETRTLRSGTKSEAEAFEPKKESKPYAKRDNEDAIDEVEMRRFVNKQYQLYIRDSIKESRQALAMDIEDGVITSKEAEAILDKLKRIA